MLGVEEEKGSSSSLLAACAKVVAKHVPFEYIERKYTTIPEPVQKQIIFWSFPRDEQDIKMYSSLAKSHDFGRQHHLPFFKGTKLMESGCVNNVLQVGFHLSGDVSQPSCFGSPLEPDKIYKVSISFDRCKIISASCSCDAKDIFFCPHVVALSLYRIRHAKFIQLRIPISETLLQFSRTQLQKLVQYLISEHHSEILPTAQKLVDTIIQNDSEINVLEGAPDPTAGPSCEEANRWHLDEDQVRDQVRSHLSSGSPYSATKHITALFSKVREMLRAGDSNGPRLLSLITEQFLENPRLYHRGSDGFERSRHLWDELALLWTCIAMNPEASCTEKKKIRDKLTGWSAIRACPPENPDSRPSRPSRSRRRFLADSDSDSSTSESSDDDEPLGFFAFMFQPPLVQEAPPDQHQGESGEGGEVMARSLLQRAVEACDYTWCDSHLQLILRHDMQRPTTCHTTSQFDKQGQPLWHESLPIACQRVETLRSHGMTGEALRLSVAIARTLRFKFEEAKETWKEVEPTMLTSCTDSGVSRNRMHSSSDPWIGHPLDPVGLLFEALLEASVPSGSTNSREASEGDDSGPVFCNYSHISVPGSQCNETYLQLAVEVALFGMCQQRLMPQGAYAQEKASKQEDRLLAALSAMEVELDAVSICALKQTCDLLLNCGPISGLGLGIHLETVPLHSVAKYLFHTLLQHDPDFAFRLGLRAIRLPILEDHEDSADPISGSVSVSILSRYPRWVSLSDIETQQCGLACTMMNNAKGDRDRLKLVLEAAQLHIRSSTHLFRLAQDAFRLAGGSESTYCPSDTPVNQALMEAALEIGLHLMKMTLPGLNWRRRDAVGWLVNCATSIGYHATVSLMKNWHLYFTPTEATGPVARHFVAHFSKYRSALTVLQLEEMSACARNLALQCAVRDPSNCALNALTLCENDRQAFEKAYAVAVEAGATVMSSTHLFNIARYMEHKGYPTKAFNLAELAMKNVTLAFNQETHPTVQDVVWACQLSHSLGKTHLTTVISVVVKNVQCAPVLADILRRCSLPQPSLGNPPESKRRHARPMTTEKQPLKMLLEATIAAYVSSTHSRLTHISPRHYTEFIEFLARAKETFLLAPDGLLQFQNMIDTIKQGYKGKKKLIQLVRERFG